MPRMSYETLIENLKTAKSGSIDLDQMVWACLEKNDWPLPHYDEDTFWQCRQESDRFARMSTETVSIAKWLEWNWPEHRVQTTFEDGRARIDVDICGLGSTIRGTFKGDLAFSDMARGLAIACVSAHAIAEKRQQLFWKHDIEAVKERVAPWEEWEIVKIGDYHHAVDHSNRLLGQGCGRADRVHAWKHRIGSPDVLLSMRERYEDAFADPGPAQDDGASEPGL